MATTSPFDVVEPLAEILGMDAVVATRYGIQKDGTYDGTIDGEFVWGKGKLRAVRSWAGANGVVVSQSWAYSDSWYDLPILDAVANPTAVNPDPRLRAMAMALRWPITHFTAPAGVPRFGGIEPQTVAIPFLRPELFPYARFDIAGTDRIPKRGPAIIVANHRSYFDPVAMALTTAKVGRPVRSLGKKEVVDAPLVGALVRAAGVIRVDRATGSDEPLRAAVTALRAGDMVSLMPQGTIPRGRAFFDPELKGRWGAARLAALSGAPVIPVGIWGTEKVWPRSSRLPDVLNLTSPPDIRVRVGPAVDLDLTDPDEDTTRIMAAISDLLPAEAHQQYEPTSEELARTLPPGYEGDPDAEVERRPGTD
jgi:putative phosphoserine phosphatase/1-acylglycerol-3-phosphate O-acyltransferase